MNDLKLKVIEKEKIQSELEMLKQQIQPHFLFNTLNTIYMLMEKDNKEAKQTLMRFSDVLSHQLYEIQEDFVSLKKEIGYIKNYCEIEQQRNEDSLNLSLNLLTDKDNYQIAPLLLIPFVENAFKHGKQADNYWVNIALAVSNKTLNMKVENSCTSSIKTNEIGGVGLRNVRRRLKLLYPEHRLTIENGKSFKVDLEIELTNAVGNAG